MNKQTAKRVAARFLHDWAEMEIAASAESSACAEIADKSDLPKTRQSLQALLERVYRKGFCAGVNQLATSEKANA